VMKVEYTCHFCGSSRLLKVFKVDQDIPNQYNCARCGDIYLERNTAEDIPGERFKDHEKRIISIWFRNEHEKRDRKPPSKNINLDDLHRIIKEYSPLEPLEKMDNALLIIDKESKFVGSSVGVMPDIDYPYFNCFEKDELISILGILDAEDFIRLPNVREYGSPLNPSITHKGYKRLSELKRAQRDSRQCFVAMWFNPEMDKVYEQAIRPAIEYVEEGAMGPRFRAVKIDNVEHINDINDEIIAAIRRSRFLVCDLTGYRGGIYFEAGFARGLGLDVIFTCRKDWLKPDEFKDVAGKPVKVLYDCRGKPITIRKEGIHFDLEHINRIAWDEDNLDVFREELTTRIKAVIL
jgi:hypothetical protein